MDPKSVLTEIQNHIRTGPASVENAAERAATIGAIYTEHRDKLLPVLNTAGTTNTISSDLKRVAILQETIRAFAVRVLPLRLFSTVFSNVPLQGTDEIVVPYFPLRTDASSTFSQATGYVFAGTVNSSSKKITVNKRLYQPLDYSSSDFRRQPHFDTVRLGMMNAEKLGVDVLAEIMKIITIASFGAAVKTTPANSMSSDDVVDLRTACNDAMWPDSGRSLIVDSSVDSSLQKDPDYKLALNIGTASVIQEGKFPRLSGFEYAWMPNLPSNSENLIGFAAFMSAILAAFCPVDPAPGVRAQLVAYQVVTDTPTGISFNYRHWGNPDADEDREVIECAFGYQAGEIQALKRIEHP